MLCDHLEEWDREGGREGDARGKRCGNICICISDSLCYKVESNTIVKQLYSNKDVKKNKVFCLVKDVIKKKKKNKQQTGRKHPKNLVSRIYRGLSK